MLHVCWRDSCNYGLREEQTWLQVAGGGVCCDERFTPGNLGLVLEPETSEGGSIQVSPSGSQQPERKGT